jgi:hypothetical protein
MQEMLDDVCASREFASERVLGEVDKVIAQLRRASPYA